MAVTAVTLPVHQKETLRNDNPPPSKSYGISHSRNINEFEPGAILAVLVRKHRINESRAGNPDFMDSLRKAAHRCWEKQQPTGFGGKAVHHRRGPTGAKQSDGGAATAGGGGVADTRSSASYGLLSCGVTKPHTGTHFDGWTDVTCAYTTQGKHHHRGSGGVVAQRQPGAEPRPVPVKSGNLKLQFTKR